MTVTMLPPPALKATSLPTFLGELLAEQQSLSAVETFSRSLGAQAEPAQARYYRALLPATPPGPGEQYGFDVDLDRCSGCKACVTACHALNGLDETETWRDVGLLLGDVGGLPVLQHVTTACHHCVDPGCMSACPTQAYIKDPTTGIVKHLDDQCFGCTYCVLACPYEVPKYHAKKGIVRKCDLCSSRLKQGEAPACVQACPHEAIRIALVSTSEARSRALQGEFLAASPDPRHTLPTTRYHSQRLAGATLHAASTNQSHAEPSHPTLIGMLLCSQVAVGLSCAVALSHAPALGLALAAAGLNLVGICCATGHLGRPLLAPRAIRGWRTSWLSREILAFAAYQQAAITTAALAWSGSFWLPASALMTAGLGLLGVFASVMLYAVTPRAAWRFPFTASRFFGTTLLGGLAGMWLLGQLTSVVTLGLCASVIAIKLLNESCGQGHLSRNMQVDGHGLWHGGLVLLWQTRTAVVALAGLLSLLTLLADRPTLAVVIGLTGLLIGEVLERELFFRAAPAPRMPGGPTV
jgi:formate dehydrogenase iron-sulfur subunit